MDPVTQARINTQMLQTLAELLTRSVKDPRVEPVTLTGVEVTADLASARVYFSVLGDAEIRRVAERGLQNVAGFLRREVSRRLRLRTSPQLRFVFDDSLERGARIETLLREWHEEDPAGPSSSTEDEGGPRE
jgi:ribosome-binding factor A